MKKRLYVGNLPYSTNESDLQEHFSQAVGSGVSAAEIITDKMTGRSKGFGFVEMETLESAEEAITKLDGSQYEGRTMKVSQAKPTVPRPPRSGFGRKRL